MNEKMNNQKNDAEIMQAYTVDDTEPDEPIDWEQVKAYFLEYAVLNPDKSNEHIFKKITQKFNISIDLVKGEYLSSDWETQKNMMALRVSNLSTQQLWKTLIALAEIESVSIKCLHQLLNVCDRYLDFISRDVSLLQENNGFKDVSSLMRIIKDIHALSKIIYQDDFQYKLNEKLLEVQSSNVDLTSLKTQIDAIVKKKPSDLTDEEKEILKCDTEMKELNDLETRKQNKSRK
jgi:hypothetical protein